MSISVNTDYNYYEKGISISADQRNSQVVSGDETESGKKDERSAGLSISKDDIAFLCSDEGYAKMKKDAEDLYAANLRQQQKLAEGRNPEDKFWNNTGDQWMTFSNALKDGGFYDNMSKEDVQEIEGLLEKITAGMDRLSKSQYNTGLDYGTLNDSGNKYFMTSAEAAVSLESSTVALQYMSEKLIPDDLKEEFNGLIDMYKKHNEEILSEYNNPVESFNKVVSNINKMGSDKIAKKPVGEYKYTVMLGEIDKTEQDKKDFRNQISEIFKRYGLKGDIATTLDMIKNQFEAYASDDSDDEGFRQYVNKEAEGLFNGIQDYWTDLINRVK